MESNNVKKEIHELVFLVDDSVIDNFVNQKMIERNHFSKKVIVFTKAMGALDYLKEADKNKSYEIDIPSIIFLDLSMPIIDGHEFIKLFKVLSDEIKNRCQLIILTSSVNPTDLSITNYNKDVLTCLSKPLMKNSFDLIGFLLNDKVSENAGLLSERHDK